LNVFLAILLEKFDEGRIKEQIIMQNKMVEESANEENKQMLTILKESGLRIWSKFLQIITQRKTAVITDSVEARFLEIIMTFVILLSLV